METLVNTFRVQVSHFTEFRINVNKSEVCSRHKLCRKNWNDIHRKVDTSENHHPVKVCTLWHYTNQQKVRCMSYYFVSACECLMYRFMYFHAICCHNWNVEYHHHHLRPLNYCVCICVGYDLRSSMKNNLSGIKLLQVNRLKTPLSPTQWQTPFPDSSLCFFTLPSSALRRVLAAPPARCSTPPCTAGYPGRPRPCPPSARQWRGFGSTGWRRWGWGTFSASPPAWRSAMHTPWSGWTHRGCTHTWRNG